MKTRETVIRHMDTPYGPMRVLCNDLNSATAWTRGDGTGPLVINRTEWHVDLRVERVNGVWREFVAKGGCYASDIRRAEWTRVNDMYATDSVRKKVYALIPAFCQWAAEHEEDFQEAEIVKVHNEAARLWSQIQDLQNQLDARETEYSAALQQLGILVGESEGRVIAEYEVAE